MKLHKVKKRTVEPQNVECRMSKDGIASLTLFFKLIVRPKSSRQAEYINSMFDPPKADKCLLASGELDVHFYEVSFSIRLAALLRRVNFSDQRRRSHNFLYQNIQLKSIYSLPAGNKTRPDNETTNVSGFRLTDTHDIATL